MVEKPFTSTAAEADKVIAAAKKSGKVLTVFQNRRYDSDYRTLAKLVKQNAFGEVTEFQNHYDTDNPEWARWTAMELSPGGGMLYGLGTHSIDQTLLLFGQPKSVTGFVRALRKEARGSKLDDTFTVILQYEGEHKAVSYTHLTLPTKRIV